MDTTERTVEDFLTAIFETAQKHFESGEDDFTVSEIFEELVMADCDYRSRQNARRIRRWAREGRRSIEVRRSRTRLSST
jgi:hypothetical protein